MAFSDYSKVCFKDTSHIKKYFKSKKSSSSEVFLTHCDKVISSPCFTLCLPYTPQHKKISKYILSAHYLLIICLVAPKF